MNEFEKAREDYEQIPIPAELEERVQAGIRQGKAAHRKAKRQRHWKRSVGAVAACFAVLVGVLNVSPTVAATAADVPVLGGLFQVLTVRSFTDKTEDRTLEVKQPGVTGGALAEQVNAEIEKAQLSYDLNKAAELNYGKLPALKKELEEAEAQSKAGGTHREYMRDAVTEEEIAEIVARWTGIPVTKLMESERIKLLHLADELHKRVIGQDEAVEKVTETILRSRAGIQDPNRPIGSFLFLGPTGVGKTELAKALAATLFDDEKNMVRIDMSEYMEKHSVSRLIGAPPGYVGYDEGGQLTEAVRRHPYSVVLFDEVEKAHPDVFNVLLQVLDDGRITDSHGRTVDFKNTLLILTSNLGSSYLLEGIEPNGEISKEARDNVEALLKQSFRPEFLNRLDEIVFYKPLTKPEISKIVDLMIQGLSNRLKEQQLSVQLTDVARSYIVENGYDPIYGARPLRRFIQSHVETMIAKIIIAGNVHEGSTLIVDANENGLYIQ